MAEKSPKEPPIIVRRKEKKGPLVGDWQNDKLELVVVKEHSTGKISTLRPNLLSRDEPVDPYNRG